MEKTLKLPVKNARAFGFERSERALDLEARTAVLAFSSEAPYERYWGIEILDHSPGAVDLTRLLATRPLLRDHNADKLIGTIESVSIGEDRVGRATVRFAKSADGEEAWQLVQDGILRNVSVGYQIDAMQLQSMDDSGLETYRVTRWTPYEISLVSIPADTSVGVGRDASAASRDATISIVINVGDDAEDAAEDAAGDLETEPASAPGGEPMVEASAPIHLEKTMSDHTNAAELLAVAEQYKRHGALDLVAAAVRDGLSTIQFQNLLLEKMASAPSAPASEIGLSKNEQKSYSVLRLMRALADPTDKAAQNAAAFELECHRAVADRIGESKRGGVYLPFEVQKRDLATNAGGGGNLVATNNLAGSFIELLRARSTVVALGARLLSGLQGNVTIPKQTAAATAYWLANESTAITESAQTIGQLALSPKNVGAYTEVSRQLMIQSAPDAEMLVMNDLAAVIALAIDAAAINGSGASGQPTGIIGTSGIGSVTGTSLGYAGIIEFQSDVAANNALTENCAYLTTPAVAALLAQRQRFTNTDSPLWSGNILDGTVSGYRATSSNQMPSANVLFGDFSQVIIADWGVVELAANPYANFAAGITGIRAWATVDVGVRQAGAFSLATSVT